MTFILVFCFLRGKRGFMQDTSADNLAVQPLVALEPIIMLFCLTSFGLLCTINEVHGVAMRPLCAFSDGTGLTSSQKTRGIHVVLSVLSPAVGGQGTWGGG